MTKRYIPARADVVLLDMEPVKGTEPGEHGRPCVVLTDKLYNKSGRTIIMMVSTSIRGTALEVPLDDLHRRGVLHRPSVLCADLVRHVDWRRRNIRQIGELGMDEYLEAIEKMGALVGDELLDEEQE